MDCLTKAQLQDMSNKINHEIVDRIVRSIYGRVLHAAGNGSYSTSWDINDYIFGDPNKITSTQMFIAVTRLKNLFPDSKISQPSPGAIRVDWY
jgi:hypothetical protein